MKKGKYAKGDCLDYYDVDGLSAGSFRKKGRARVGKMRKMRIK